MQCYHFLYGYKDIIEVEIKTSFAYLKNLKRSLSIPGKEDKPRKFKPQKFYFIIPGELFKRVKTYVEEKEFPKC